MNDYAGIWRDADKVVYSTTLQTVSSDRTRIERAFDPEEVRRMTSSAERDISVGGPGLARRAFEAGIDECHLFLTPIVVKSGTRSLPGGARIDLDLLDQRRFDNGTVHLHYRVIT